MPQNTCALRRSGFTLIELLVALILIALLLGAVVPAVLNQIVKGDTNRILEDLDAVNTAAQTFRMDVNRWPGDLEDLIVEPSVASSTLDADIDGSAYTQGMINRWDGAYLDAVSLTSDSTLATGGEGFILNEFSTAFSLNTDTYVSFVVSGLTASQLEAIDVAVDGASGTAVGRVRISGTDLYYLGSPKR